MDFRQKYGSTALIAGASEGIGAAFAERLAENGMDLVLVARRIQPLQQLADRLENRYRVKVKYIPCDLSEDVTSESIKELSKGSGISMLVYNAALSRIGPFFGNSVDLHLRIASTNMLTPLKMLHVFGEEMLASGKGAVILISSMAGLQGSGYLSVYAASKAFIRVLAESLWFEWKKCGVDVIACCAGATSTPGFIASNPGRTGIMAPRILTPEEVVTESLKMLGKRPSFIAGRGNRLASFFMHRILPLKSAVNIMGKTTARMYGFRDCMYNKTGVNR